MEHYKQKKNLKHNAKITQHIHVNSWSQEPSVPSAKDCQQRSLIAPLTDKCRCGDAEDQTRAIIIMLLLPNQDRKRQMTPCDSMNNIRTLSANVNFICTSFRSRKKGELLVNLSFRFRGQFEYILYFLTTYLYCHYTPTTSMQKMLNLKTK